MNTQGWPSPGKNTLLVAEKYVESARVGEARLTVGMHMRRVAWFRKGFGGVVVGRLCTASVGWPSLHQARHVESVTIVLQMIKIQLIYDYDCRRLDIAFGMISSVRFVAAFLDRSERLLPTNLDEDNPHAAQANTLLLLLLLLRR
jgi:hypothetical protein